MKLAVIFDMDGVLVNTVPVIWDTFKVILREQGVILPDKDLPLYRGVSWPDTLKIWEKKYHLSFNEQAFAQRIVEEELKHFDSEKTLSPNVVSFLTFLRKQNVPIAIGTSSPRWRAELILEKSKLNSFFDAVVTADDVVEHKPSPQLFLLAAKKMNVFPENCIVIEDGLSGVEAAKRAGMKSIGYAQSPENNRALGKADIVISDFSELSIEKLQKLFEM